MSDLVRAPTSIGSMPPLGVEAAVVATGLVSWCALVAAPLAMSASATVLVVCLAKGHPLDNSPLEWGAEVRVEIRQALRSGCYADISGIMRMLEYKKACPTDAKHSSHVDRPRLRLWAAGKLRELGVEKLRTDDKLDSLYLMTRKKKD